jgi:hypothetical protein
MIAPASGTIIEVIGRGLRCDFDSDSGSDSCFNSDFCLRFSHLMNMILMIAPAAEPTTRPQAGSVGVFDCQKLLAAVLLAFSLLEVSPIRSAHRANAS